MKNLELIAQCSTIEELATQNGTIDGLDFTLKFPLEKLVLDNIKTRVDKLVIPNISTLESFGLSGVHKVGDLDFLSNFIGLRELTLSWLKTKYDTQPITIKPFAFIGSESKNPKACA